MQQAEVPLISRETCRRSYGNNRITERMRCITSVLRDYFSAAGLQRIEFTYFFSELNVDQVLVFNRIAGTDQLNSPQSGPRVVRKLVNTNPR